MAKSRVCLLFAPSWLSSDHMCLAWGHACSLRQCPWGLCFFFQWRAKQIMACGCFGTHAAFLFRCHAYRSRSRACFCWLLFSLAISFANDIFCCLEVFHGHVPSSATDVTLIFMVGHSFRTLAPFLGFIRKKWSGVYLGGDPQIS